jgi:glutathione S-transferase
MGEWGVSTLILRHLDQVQPTPALMSEDATIAAQQRMLEDWSDESFYWYMQALRWSIGTGGWRKRHTTEEDPNERLHDL